MEESGVPQTDGPPPLPYSLRQRKKSIAFFWTLFVIDTLAQPLVLFWALKYCTSLSLNLVFSISTAALGGISVFEYFYRLYNLMRKRSRARPLNARKSWLDFFQINFTIVWLCLAVELIVGTVSSDPRVRLLAMPLPTVMFYFGAVHLTLDVLRIAGFKAPFRISSTHQGSAMPTALYVLVEDIVAVDGGGGQKFRYALRTRYLSSPYFRRMLFEMNCFWAGGSLIAAAAITAIIFTLDSEDIAYTLGWSLPFAWATVWTLITFPWVQAELRREKETWNRVQHFGGGEPYTDDITVNPRTRYNSIQARILPFSGREKQEQASSPPGSSTVTDDTTMHTAAATATATLPDDNNNTNNPNHNHTNSNDTNNTEQKESTESNVQDTSHNTNANINSVDDSRIDSLDHDHEAQEKELKPDV